MAPRVPYSSYTYTDPRVQGNIFRMLGHTPATCESWLQIGTAHLKGLSICHYHRELVVLAVAAGTGALYEWAHHVPISAKYGVTAENLDEIKRVMQGTGNESVDFSGSVKWKDEQKDLALLRLVKGVVKGGDKPVEDPVLEAVRKHFSDREIMEIVTVAVSSFPALSISHLSRLNVANMNGYQ